MQYLAATDNIIEISFTINKMQVTVISCFYLSGRGITVFLKNDNSNFGLPKGTVLQSIQSGESWIVDKRIIAFDAEIPFENETVSIEMLHFSSIENATKASQASKERVGNNIFQYRLIPVSGNTGPNEQEILNIIRQSE